MNTTFRRDPRDDATPSNRGRGAVHVLLYLLQGMARHLYEGFLLCDDHKDGVAATWAAARSHDDAIAAMHRDAASRHAVVIPQVLAHHEPDVRGLPLVGVVEPRPLHQEPRVRQGVAHALRARAAEEGAHARGQSQIYRRDRAL